MLQEAIDLQARAVDEVVQLLPVKEIITFKAPTGAGKTHMMADVMNQVLSVSADVVFLVSALSKGNLAKQNYDSFRKYVDDGVFPYLEPFIITTDKTAEEGVHIPEDRNVYVLPRDLVKDGSLLSQGPLERFFLNIKANGKKIYVIKDECHQATNNLDEYSNFFDRVVNVSATPDEKKKQYVDVEITDEEAVEACLIKKSDYQDYDDMNSQCLTDALSFFESKIPEYVEKLNIKPCFIIQISNKGKCEEELKLIKSVLSKEHPELIWAYLVSNTTTGEDRLGDTNDSGLKKLPVSEWKDMIRMGYSTVDVVIFKMVISEGWDIPRACMLYQIRNTSSKTLDEQVIGRVRRNPRLLDFEELDEDAKKLATTAWIWGLMPKDSKVVKVKRMFPADELKVKITKLHPVAEQKSFDIQGIIASQPKTTTHESIFDMYRVQKRMKPDVKEEYREYVQSVDDWYKFVEALPDIKAKVEEASVDYDKTMYVPKDENGNDILVSLPDISYYTHKDKIAIVISNWMWGRTDGSKKFSFDSAAETNWAEELKTITLAGAKSASTGAYLVGKNYTTGSSICYEYYADGVHKSYPDFILKDQKDRIHIFESKSENENKSIHMDGDKYLEKIEYLREAYLHASKLTGHHFYIPIQNGDDWTIDHFFDGQKEILYSTEEVLQVIMS